MESDDDAAATVVEVVEVPLEPQWGEADVELDTEVAASSSNSVATFRSAATMLGVGGADPNVSSSDSATGPTTNRMYWANF